MAVGLAHNLTGRGDDAIAAYELAVELNPSSSLGQVLLGSALATSGRPDEGIAKLERGIRLSPQDPQMWMYLLSIGLAHFAAERYGDAVDAARRSLQQRPNFAVNHRLLAASYAHLGRLDEARTALEASLRLQPESSLSAHRATLPSANPAFVERFIDGLRKAGLKE